MSVGHEHGGHSTETTCCAGLAAQPDLGAARDLEALREAYMPGAPRFRFQHLLLNVVDAPAARVKPPGVDELRWREALQVPAPNMPAGDKNSSDVELLVARQFRASSKPLR